MTRLTRIVCDNPDCTAQVEYYAGDYFRNHMGEIDTPGGWYRLTYNAHPMERSAAAADVIEHREQPRYFCSVTCVRNYTGDAKEPQTRAC